MEKLIFFFVSDPENTLRGVQSFLFHRSFFFSCSSSSFFVFLISKNFFSFSDFKVCKGFLEAE